MSDLQWVKTEEDNPPKRESGEYFLGSDSNPLLRVSVMVAQVTIVPGDYTYWAGPFTVALPKKKKREKTKLEIRLEKELAVAEAEGECSLYAAGEMLILKILLEASENGDFDE